MTTFEYKRLTGDSWQETDDRGYNIGGRTYDGVSDTLLEELSQDGWKIVFASFYPNGQVHAVILIREIR